MLVTILVLVVIVESIVILVGAYKVTHHKFDGAMVVKKHGEKTLFSIEVEDTDDIPAKKQLVLEVVKSPE